MRGNICDMTNEAAPCAAHRVPKGTPRVPDRQEAPQQPPPAPRSYDAVRPFSVIVPPREADRIAASLAGAFPGALPASQDCAAPEPDPLVHLAVCDVTDEDGDPIGVQVLGAFAREEDARLVREADRVEAHRLRTGPPAYTTAYRIRWRTRRPDGPAEPPYSIPNPWPHSFGAMEPVAFGVHWERLGPGYSLEVTGPDEDAVRELYEQERAAYERGGSRVREGREED